MKNNDPSSYLKYSLIFFIDFCNFNTLYITELLYVIKNAANSTDNAKLIYYFLFNANIVILFDLPFYFFFLLIYKK